MIHALALNKSPSKSPLTPSQNAFNRHFRKIDKLRGELEEVKSEYEQALLFYHSDLKPLERKAGDLISQFLLRMRELTLDPKALNKEERRIFQVIVKDSLHLLFAFIPPEQVDDRLKDLFEKSFGKSCSDRFQEEMGSLKEMLQEEMGLDDIDLSQVKSDDDYQEIFVKLAEAMRAAGIEEKEEFSPPPKQKTKKEQLQEKIRNDLEALKGKGINQIYKRLVKEFHPDLEQDLEKRSEKETLMKRATVAYEKRDLVSLLALEAESLSHLSGGLESANEETFTVYNALLKDQIKSLEQEFLNVQFDPRYFPIHQFIRNYPKKPLTGVNEALSECHSLIHDYSTRLKDLSGNHPLRSLKEILALFGKNEAAEEAFDFFKEIEEMFIEEDFDFKPMKKKKSRAR